MWRQRQKLSFLLIVFRFVNRCVLCLRLLLLTTMLFLISQVTENTESAVRAVLEFVSTSCDLQVWQVRQLWVTVVIFESDIYMKPSRCAQIFCTIAWYLWQLTVIYCSVYMLLKVHKIKHGWWDRGRWKCWTWKWRRWNWRTNVQGMKLQDMKMTDQMTGHENAGHEIAGHKRAGYETDSEAANVWGWIDWVDLALLLCSLLRFEKCHKD